MNTTDEQIDVPKAAGTATKAVVAIQTVRKLALPAKLGLGLLGTVQFAFAFLAFWDLAIRDRGTVRGPKPVWIPVILVNWIGPAAYFIFGVKR